MVSKELQIVHYGDPILRRSAALIKRVTPDLKALVPQMETVMRGCAGVGLAAPQVGIGRQFAIINIGEEADGGQQSGTLALVNPRLIHAEGEEVMVEGCLSLPGLYAEVTRAAKVIVEATDLSGKQIRIEAEGMLARVLQHEIDHLQGRLFIDSADESTLYWLVKPAADDGPGCAADTASVAVPTTLQDALRVFLSKPSS